MTVSEIQALIFGLTGHTTGCRKNTGSMKHYLTFQILPIKDRYSEKFTQQQQEDVKKALSMRGTFTDWYRIEVKEQHITPEPETITIQKALF